MSSKRPASPTLIPNPLVKKRNLLWTLVAPTDTANINTNTAPDTHNDSSKESVSPPAANVTPKPSAAAVESGEAFITDHLTQFASHLSNRIADPFPDACARLSVPDYARLYQDNAGSPHGAHFVIHQHDHPVAGTHYDLRLQINESSSASWAFMYGLPGDPNSVRLNRNATETRVHCLWNHLIETASSATGSLLLWDTGTYTILPRRSKHAPRQDPSSPAASPGSPSSSGPASQQSLLHAAFQTRKIRLRLHGTRLPEPYVLNLRLTKSEDAAGRVKSARGAKYRRRGRGRGRATAAARTEPETSSDEDGSGRNGNRDDKDDGVVLDHAAGAKDDATISAMEREIRELEDEQVRRTNAYPGAVNTIGSVHQRKWYLSVDRLASGFAEVRRGGQKVWEHPTPGSTEAELVNPSQEQGAARSDARRLSFPFYVRGAECERSVVTGRRGQDILRDEGVTDFVPRKGWSAVLN